MPATSGHDVDHAHAAGGPGDQCGDQGGLADAGMADEHADAVNQEAPQRFEPDPFMIHRVARGDEVTHLEHRVVGQEGRRVDQIGLGQDQEWLHPRVVCSHQTTVDHPGSRLRVDQRRDDDQLLGVGHDDALDGVSVVGGAAKNGATGFDANDPGQRVLPAGGVTDQRHLVADDDALASQLAGLHGDDHPLAAACAVTVHDQRVATAVNTSDETRDGVVVRGAVLRAWPGAAAVWPDPDVALVVGAGARTHQPMPLLLPSRSLLMSSLPSIWPMPLMSSLLRSPSSTRVQRSVKKGSVLAVVSTFSMTMPGTRRPSTAPAIAIR